MIVLKCLLFVGFGVLIDFLMALQTRFIVRQSKHGASIVAALLTIIGVGIITDITDVPDMGVWLDFQIASLVKGLYILSYAIGAYLGCYLGMTISLKNKEESTNDDKR